MPTINVHNDTSTGLTDKITYGAGYGPNEAEEIRDGRLQELLATKDDQIEDDLVLWGESWSIIDGALVISFEGYEPGWLELLKSMRDDNGYTQAAVKAPTVSFTEPTPNEPFAVG